MAEDKLKITKKDSLKGNDGYKVFSVRLKDETVAALNTMTDKTGRSRNKLINVLLTFAIENSEIEE